MRFELCCLCLLVSTAANAQVPPQPASPKRVLELRGDRFPGLTYEELTSAQKVLADRALAGRGPIGTFNILLRSPELSGATRGTAGARNASALSAKQNELAILINARFWTTQFEWYVHHRAAVQAGLSEATVSALIEGRRPASLLPDEEPIYNFLVELMNTKQVSDGTFQAAKASLGEKGIVDLIGITGFYSATSLLMNVDRYPMQSAAQKPELKPLERPLPYTKAAESSPSRPAPKSAGRLRGDRFKPLTDDEMTLEQKALMDRVVSGKLEGGTNGPLNVLLRSPDYGEAILRYGAYVRFHSPLPTKLNELAALVTIRDWGAQFPWYAHHRAAAQAGLDESIIGAIAQGKQPVFKSPEEQAVYNFCAELLRTRQTGDNTFRAVKDRVGERGVVELMGVMGYYQVVSMLLNIDRYPMPEGVAGELQH